MHGTGTSAMNSFRLSGSTDEDTCSAEITVPWITSTSRPASSATSQYSRTRWGVREPEHTTPSALISRTRCATSSGFTGSL